MELIYSHQELIAISQSPLCIKPDHLGPNEDWMGPPIVVHPNSRKTSFSKPDGDSDESFVRKSYLNRDDKPSRSRQDDIVLGPPKISFGSSIAGSRKTADSDSRDINDVSTGSKVTTSKYGVGSKSSSYNRRTIKEEEGDDWKEVRHMRKSFGADESEKFRRNKDDSAPRERRTKDGSGGSTRLHEGSWRDRDQEREKERRDGFAKAGERQSATSGRYSTKRPEWMDAPAAGKDGAIFSNSEFAQAAGSSGLASASVPATARGSSSPEHHSIEDFEAWKAKMKAADKASKGEAVTSSGSETLPQSASSVGDGVDRFFGMFSPSITADGVKALSSSVESFGFKSPSEGSRSSRFSSFFKPEQVSAQEAVVSPPVSEKPGIVKANSSVAAPESQPSSTNEGSHEEHEGFKRIIALLGSKGDRASQTPSPVATSAQSATASEPPKPAVVQNSKEQPKSQKDSSNAQFLMGLMSQSSKEKIRGGQPSLQEQQLMPPLRQMASYEGRARDPPLMSPPILQHGSSFHDTSRRPGQPNGMSPQWTGPMGQKGQPGMGMTPDIPLEFQGQIPAPLLSPNGGPMPMKDPTSPQMNGSGPGMFPPFMPGMVPNIPLGSALPPFPPNGMPPNFPFFGMNGGPPPLPPGFPPPHMREPGMNMPPRPPPNGMLPGGGRGGPIPPSLFGPVPPGLGLSGMPPMGFEGDKMKSPADGRPPAVAE
ncbi:hypothetical protein V1512DRAFT_256103 [Lipomyces arxii]|uniref:uncharacterized protein n=1 Tax=Lipomyces arxii TaxID=56418 RepID=UPI0034CF53D9